MYTTENRYCTRNITDKRNVIIQNSLTEISSYTLVTFTNFSKDADNTGISFNEEDDVLYPDRKKGKIIAVTGRGGL
jgi:hypothetical protein